MKPYLFDTCALVAGCVEDHQFHPQTKVWMELACNGKIRAHVSTHTIAEFFAIMTRLPDHPSYSATFVTEYYFGELARSFSPVPLVPEDYRLALERTTRANRKGGAVFDALHIQSALKIKAFGIVTFNEKDFIALVGKDKIEIVNPLRERS